MHANNLFNLLKNLSESNEVSYERKLKFLHIIRDFQNVEYFNINYNIRLYELQEKLSKFH